MPMIVIVDENDNVLGHKERTDKLTTPGIYRLSALWLTNSQGDVLLAKRSSRKEIEPGLWGPAVAGTVEEGETYESTLERETYEEIGIRLPASSIPFCKILCVHLIPHYIQFFVALIDEPVECFKIQIDEVEELKWFSRDLLMSELKISPEKFVISVRQCAESFLLIEAS